jgi:serine/threonine protein kinase
MAEGANVNFAPTPGEQVDSDWPSVPRYEIIAELGRGGMGVVYKAREAASGRLVALKMIRDAALAGAQDRDRFRIESEAATRMRHPNIVQIYEVGNHAGCPYFAMQFVEGGSLAEWIAEARVENAASCLSAARLLMQIAYAVQHAHERGVLHRDLKPANILLQSAPGALSTATDRLQSAHPMLADFGLAKRMDSQSTAWTQEGAVVGTARYMAPEQAAGRIGELGPAVDVYAVGAILYELVTGRPPFESDSWNEMLQKVLHDEPAPPRRLRQVVPRDLETVCLKCLEKEPGRRYATAAELADDLRRFVEGQPVVAVPPGELERLARRAGRDGYEIVEVVGAGPRSTVYRALEAPLKRTVALKVFGAGISTREEWEVRLARSAEIWAALAHPQIIPFHRAGWWDDAPWVEMEFVPQGSLASRLSGRVWPIASVVRLVAQLAEIVCYMHRQGVVHGNLKPSNILFAAGDIPRVADLRFTGGLFLAALPVDAPSHGGIAYLPPELVGNPGMELRPNMDIYGLGAILYELLTGRPPFAGETVRDTQAQVQTLEPVSPSNLNPEVTLDLETICLRCLRKNPWQRYMRAYNLLTRLRSSDFRDGRNAPGRGR